MPSGAREYKFDDDGVTIASEYGGGLSRWNAFLHWGMYKSIVYLLRNDNQYVLVNVNNLPREDVEALFSLLNAHLMFKEGLAR